MKTATLPPLRVEPELREAAERVLEAGESLSSFVEQAVRSAVSRREAQAAFLARALASRDQARESGEYASSQAVLDKLQQRLEAAKVDRRKRS
ncbi:YlcI/YnfO family protein [Pigmentiphaga sp. D-2]|uniref:YlcI/YnfO family protein n=1 Tax=Pigmentiphaga sp. D-2 TaxID=1002116 RepID=UPI001052CB37|nr:YlcI/YnfO family protein [Pigmentiphaga sp. D-2]